MSRISGLREKARAQKRTIVLPEGDDPRVVKGASFAVKDGIADVVLLGKEAEVRDLADEHSVSLDGVTLVDPSSHEAGADIINAYYELRKNKGVTPEQAKDILTGNPVFYGAMMTRMGMADGFVAGANHTTGDVARAAIQCIKIEKEIGTVSSSFVMELENCPFGENGLFVYGDCAIIPYPSSRQLSGIAIASAGLFRKLFGIEPRVALLSYSTKGSAEGESIDKVREAFEKVRAKKPDLMIDGELQIDSALVPEIAGMKCKGSDVAGKANVLIFPNLDAGNISYKLTQRLGGARAVGPILQGLEKPCSDLSRGCSWEDVVDVTAVVATLSQE